jgi:predicted transcriptional regulator
MPKPTSVRLKNDLADQLDQLAIAVNRPKTWLIEEAVRRYVEEQSWQIAAIRQELEDHQSGKGIAELAPQDTVMRKVEARIRAKRATQ